MLVPEGWRYIKLPQSIYITSPKEESFYFGDSDFRFPLLNTEESLDRIATFSFLECGEFLRQPDGTYNNGHFSLPPVTLQLMFSLPPEERAAKIVFWQNIGRRKPEAIQAAVTLTSLTPYTKDGMFLSSMAAIPQALHEVPDLVFFSPTPPSTFEEEVEKRGMKLNKPTRTLLLHYLTHAGKYHGNTAWPWFEEFFATFEVNQVQKILEQKEFVKSLFLSSGPYAGSLFVKQKDGKYPVRTFLKQFGFRRFWNTVVLGKETPLNFVTLLYAFSMAYSNLSHFYLVENVNTPEKDQRVNFFRFIQEQRLGFIEIIVLLDMLKEGSEIDIAQIRSARDLREGAGLKGVGFEVRRAVHRIELNTWGHILSNCLKTSSFNPERVWGIFKDGNLCGAAEVQVTPEGISIRQISSRGNVSFPSAEAVFLRTMVLEAAMADQEQKKSKAYYLQALTPVI